MMIFLLHLVLGLSFAASTSLEAKSYDLNSDSRIDYIEITSNGLPVERQEDLDFDGQMDRKETYFVEGEFFKIIEQRKFGENHRKRVVFWHDLERMKTISKTQVDYDNDGTWDHDYLITESLIQEKDCPPTPNLGSVKNFGEDGLKIISQENSYTHLPNGYKIHESCLAGGKKDWFIKNATESLKNGLACFGDLAKAGGTGAAKNLISLQNLLKVKTVQLICHETNYKWSKSSIAHATSGTTHAKEDLPLVHPGISLNPKILDRVFKSRPKEDLEFQRTLFHEQLHNLGHRHGSDVEYSYTCEKCCFNAGKPDEVEAMKAACKICQGNYAGLTDPKYLRDITHYGKTNYEADMAVRASIAYLKENPGSVEGISYLAANMSGYFDPIGAEIAQLIKKDGPKLTPPLTELINRADEYGASKEHRAIKHASRPIAEAYYELYFKGNPTQALKIIEANSQVLNKTLKTTTKNKEANWMIESLSNGLSKLMNDIWVNNYMGKVKDESQIKKIGMDAFILSEKLKY